MVISKCKGRYGWVLKLRNLNFILKKGQFFTLFNFVKPKPRLFKKPILKPTNERNSKKQILSPINSKHGVGEEGEA